MSRSQNDNLIIYPECKNNQWGVAVCVPGKKAFIPDEVILAYAFGDNPGLAETVSFQRLQENFRAELEGLRNTEQWDKRKAGRHIEQLLQMFVYVHGYGFELGRNAPK